MHAEACDKARAVGSTPGRRIVAGGDATLADPATVRLLGMVAADGWFQDERYLVLTLSAVDRVYLEAVADWLEVPRERLYNIPPRDCRGIRSGSMVRLRVVAPALATLAVEHGITGKDKSTTLRISSELAADIRFWAGYLDGDGCWSLAGGRSPHVQLGTASQALADQFVNFLAGLGLTARAREGVTGFGTPFWTVEMKGWQAYVLAKRVLQAGPDLALPRKLVTVRELVAATAGRIEAPPPGFGGLPRFIGVDRHPRNAERPWRASIQIGNGRPGDQHDMLVIGYYATALEAALHRNAQVLALRLAGRLDGEQAARTLLTVLDQYLSWDDQLLLARRAAAWDPFANRRRRGQRGPSWQLDLTGVAVRHLGPPSRRQSELDLDRAAHRRGA